MNDAERWNLGKEWTGTFDSGEGCHPISVSSVGVRYDGQGFFASQFKSYRAASHGLRERRLDPPSLKFGRSGFGAWRLSSQRQYGSRLLLSPPWRARSRSRRCGHSSSPAGL